MSFRVTRAPRGKLSGALPGSGAPCRDWACMRMPLLSCWIRPSPGTLPGAYALHLTTKSVILDRLICEKIAVLNWLDSGVICSASFPPAIPLFDATPLKGWKSFFHMHTCVCSRKTHTHTRCPLLFVSRNGSWLRGAQAFLAKYTCLEREKQHSHFL